MKDGEQTSTESTAGKEEITPPETESPGRDAQGHKYPCAGQEKEAGEANSYTLILEDF